MKQIAAALLCAKKTFGPALKEKTNPAFKSKYADLGSCLNAVDKPCLDAGIILYQETFEDPGGVTIETVFLHESGEVLRCGKFHVPASKQDPQGYGSALTYARRYSLMTACGIAPEDDDGNAAGQPPLLLLNAAEQPPLLLLNAAQCANITAMANEVGANFEALMNWVSKAVGTDCKELTQVPATAYEPIIKQLKKKKEAK
jgi:hypothetical protein